MSLPTFRVVLPLLALAILGAGCSAAAPGASSPSALSGWVSRGPCDNQYYPLIPGYSTTFKSVDSSGTTSTHTISVANSSGNNVVLRYAYSQLADANNITQKLTCRDGEISALGYMDLGSAVNGMKLTTETKKASGPLLPARLSVGTEWDNAYEIVSTIDDPQMAKLGMNTFAGSISSHNKVLREERVTVPAGSYDALIIESVSKDVMTIGGRNIPSTSTSTEFWVKGVGLVKSISKESTDEAVKITLP